MRIVIPNEHFCVLVEYIEDGFFAALNKEAWKNKVKTYQDIHSNCTIIETEDEELYKKIRKRIDSDKQDNKEFFEQLFFKQRIINNKLEKTWQEFIMVLGESTGITKLVRWFADKLNRGD